MLRILEVGAAVGFSSILMSEYMPEGGHITTIENYDKRIPIARANFKRAGKEEQIDLIEGDALEVMHGLEGNECTALLPHPQISGHTALPGHASLPGHLPQSNQSALPSLPV